MSKEIIALSLRGIYAKLHRQGGSQGTVALAGKIRFGKSFRMESLSKVVKDGPRGGLNQIMARRAGAWTKIAWAVASAARMPYREVWGVDPPEEFGEAIPLPYRQIPPPAEEMEGDFL